MHKDNLENQFPCLCQGVKRQKRPVRLDLIRKDGLVITLNATGTVIGECIDGKMSLLDILHRLESKYIMAQNLLLDDLFTLICRLEELEFIHINSKNSN